MGTDASEGGSLRPSSKTVRSVIVLDDGKTHEYAVSSDTDAYYLYLRLQAGKLRQEVYIRDVEGNDFKLIPTVDFKLVRVSDSKDTLFLTTVGHVLHDALYQKRERK